MLDAFFIVLGIGFGLLVVFGVCVVLFWILTKM